LYFVALIGFTHSCWQNITISKAGKLMWTNCQSLCNFSLLLTLLFVLTLCYSLSKTYCWTYGVS